MLSARNTAIYAKEMTESNNKNMLNFLFYDFQKVVKKIILNEDVCPNKKIELDFNEFKMKAELICQDKTILIDYFGTYKNVSSSHREIVLIP